MTMGSTRKGRAKVVLRKWKSPQEWKDALKRPPKSRVGGKERGSKDRTSGPDSRDSTGVPRTSAPQSESYHLEGKSQRYSNAR